MIRPSVILILALLYISAPVLCVGGVLAHACECGALAACSHEMDRNADPCEISFAPTDGRSATGTSTGPDAVITREVNPAAADLSEPGLLQNRPGTDVVLDGLGIPASDIPQLL